MLRSRSSLFFFFSSLLAPLALLAGCPSPGTYGTPRTVRPGGLMHTIAVDTVHMQGVDIASEPREQTAGTMPVSPIYQLRTGITDRVDAGLRVGAQLLGFDAKWNVLRSELFDLAVVPGLQGHRALLDDAYVLYTYLPFVLGFNLGRSSTVVMTLGAARVFPLAGVADDGNLVAHAGFLALAGLGIAARTSDGVIVQPEVTAMRSFNDTETLVITFGIGVSFGDLPARPR